MNRTIALGLAMVAASIIGATAADGLHDQNNTPAAYAVLDLRAINTPDVFKNASFQDGRLRQPYCLTDYADHPLIVRVHIT
jgi:hypothetical protein